MTIKHEYKGALSVAMFDALKALYAINDTPDFLAVVSIVLATLKEHDSEEAAPAKPKQRRARRKKANEPGTMVELAKGAINA